LTRALDAGATIERPATGAPGGRGGWVIDPFDHRWSIMTPNPDFTPEHMQ
jgi:PhnB protein